MKVTRSGDPQRLMSNAHPPGFYRATAALKHVDAFYEAFDIREGDKEWLPAETAREGLVNLSSDLEANRCKGE